VQASSGAMGGSKSTEFMVLCEAGEDRVVICKACDYSANMEKATSKAAPSEAANDAVLEEFATPNVHTIDDLVQFTGGAPAKRQIKTLVYVVDGKLGLVLVRGDHQLNETKLQDAMHARELHAASAPEIVAALGASPGSLGAVGVVAGKTHQNIAFVVADLLLVDAKNMVTGANKDYVHVRGVSVGRDVQPTVYHDLRSVNEGEPCTECGAPLIISKALEIGHVFKLGTRYSDAMNATVLSSGGDRVPIVMGSYGIGVERLLAAIVEMHHDEKGIIWPAAVAPYFILITPTNMSDPAVCAAAESIYKDMSDEGYEVLIDDRDERAGVKFNDADLIGIPYRVTIGKKAKDGIVELYDRATKNTLEIELTKVAETVTNK
jgi:prolyl-tRNA synthetase